MFWYYGGYGLLLVCVLISLFAELKVHSAYKRYSAVSSQKGYTGYTAARQILDSNGLSHVAIEKIGGRLSDHYDPRANVIRLSADVYDGNSVAAIGVAAHECGHAVQYAEEYKPIVFRNAIVKSTNFCSRISFILILIGVLIIGISAAADNAGMFFIYLGIVAFSATAFFQLVTLPVEFNASRRALATLSGQNMLNEEELEGSRKVLGAAAMTYVAALVVSILQIARLILIFGRRKN